MDAQITGSWKQFETWIRITTIGGFCWKIRPRSSRQMVADLILDAIKRNNGTFFKNNSFIEFWHKTGYSPLGGTVRVMEKAVRFHD